MPRGGKGSSKYNPERLKRLTDAIRQGATIELACKYAGIHYSTLDNWRDGKYVTKAQQVELIEALQKAEGDAAVSWLARIEQAANHGSWQAAAWKLERRYPESYGRRIVEASGPDGGPIKHEHTHKHFDLSRFSPEELEDLDRLAAVYDSEEYTP